MGQKKKIIALDIGSHSAKVAVAVVDKADVKITRLESFRLPVGEKNVVEAIRPWMEKNGFSSSRAVVSLSGKDVIFQPFQLVPADPRTPEQAASMEVLKFNEMASETMIFDFSEFKLGKEDRRLLLAIARPSLLDTPLTLANARNLQIEDIVPSPVAAFNALAEKYAGDKETTLFVHAGHATTSVGISIKGQLVFARAFACGGHLFTSAIVDSADVSPAQAENTKHASAALSSGPYAEALTKAAQTWFTELSSCLSIFKSLFPSDTPKITSVVLTGGTANLNGLPAFLQDKLGVEIIVPGKEDPPPSDHIPPEFVVCAGLAHSLTDEPRAGISLLPDYIRDGIASRRQRPFWYAAAGAAAAILIVSVIGGYLNLKRTKAYLNSQRADLRTREQLAAQIESVRMKNAKMRDLAAPMIGLMKATPVMTSVIKTVAENRGAREWITVVCDADSYFRPQMYSQDTAPEDRLPSIEDEDGENVTQRTGISSVIIEGFTRDSSLSSVSTLISQLQKLDFVESADLLSDDMLATLEQKNLEEKLNAIRFAIEVKVTQE